MGIFWWIPALVPLLGALIILACPGRWAWPISRWEGAYDGDEIRTNWKKFICYLGINILACLLLPCGLWYGVVSKTMFKEVWNFQIYGIRHEMEWTTKESYTVRVDDGSFVDSNGNVTHNSHTEVRYRTDHHGPYWYRIDEYGDECRIDQGEYDEWKRLWNNECQTGMNEGSAAGFHSKIDGPILECFWPKTFETIYPATAVYHYKNKVRASNSVLRWGKPTTDILARYPRPVDKGNTWPVINYGGIRLGAEDMLYLRRVNASLGRRYEVHPIIVAFDKNTEQSVVADVISAWQGPNMNELVTFISLDGQTIRWVEVHSWMDNTTIHATLRDELMGEPFTVHRYGELLRKYVPKLWHRNDFSVFQYLQVSIHPGWIILALVLSALVGVISYFVIENIFYDETWSGGYFGDRDGRDWPYGMIRFGRRY